MLAVVIEHVHLVAVEEQPGCLVTDECVLVPAVPQRAHDLDELFASLVAHSLGRMRLVAEIQRLGRIARGYDVPAGPAATDEVERGELPSDPERLLEAGRGRANKADVPRESRQGG